jgi:hypothetical protein
VGQEIKGPDWNWRRRLAQRAIENFVGSRNTRRRWRFWVMHDRDHCIERIFGVLQRLLGEGPLLPRPENASCTQSLREYAISPSELITRSFTSALIGHLNQSRKPCQGF